MNSSGCRPMQRWRTIRLDRPPMNALNAQVQDELAAAAAQVTADEQIRAVVLYGGGKVFAAGADIKEMAEASYAAMAAHSRRLQAAFTAIAKIPKPVVAAITGYALGGGLELALCADFRVVGEGAKVGQPEIQLGVIPGAGGTQRLPRLIGPARAKDIVYTGRFVAAPEALAIGLADRVVPDEDVYQAAAELAGRFASGPAAGPARRQAGHRRGPRSGPRRRTGDRAAALRRALRHRGPARRACVVSSRMDLGRPHSPGADEVRGDTNGAIMTEPGDALSLDLVAAALRADSADVAVYARVLTDSLGDALPKGVVTVDRERSVSDRMRGRPGEVAKITVRLGDQMLTLAVQRGQPVAEICREVRGVVLSRRPVQVTEWAAELAKALVAYADQNAQAAQVLRRLVAGN